ncbi:MAG TPA: hypothetical protein VF980_21145, partial [Thermoanaerobaculia bacterium]
MPRTKLWWRVAIVLLALACKQPVQQLRKAAGAPQVPATVVTIRTTIQPGNKTVTSTIAITTDLARGVQEVGTWRLFDLNANRVAFVDDFAKTFRWESLESLASDRADDA